MKIPLEIKATCQDWYNGFDSAMWAAATDRPFDPEALLRETVTAIVDLSPKDLTSVEAWVRFNVKDVKPQAT